MRASEEELHLLAENIDKVFWIHDEETKKLLYVSPAYERISGRSCQSLYEQEQEFFDLLHPNDRDRMLAERKRALRGEDCENEYQIVRPDGSVRWIHDQTFAVRNDKGEIYRLVGLAEDVTERQRLEEQFRQAQKMEAIGQLAGGIAHDFNNILAATLMQLGLLRQSPQLTPGMKQDLKEIENEIMRATHLTRQLLLFSRRQVARFEPLDMNALINDLFKMLRRLLGEDIRIDFHASSVTPWAKGDPGMIEQVVMNLCVNARDAMPKGGKLTLKTAIVERDAGFAKTHPDARPGRFVCLEVTDTGCGMAEPVLKRIFEPFFTTKEVGKGTGLGLATVYGIVKQHEGWVEVQSVVGKGTSFLVHFPAYPAPAGKTPATGCPEEAPGGSGTILFVEDELSLRRSTALCLRMLGYGVLEAANGAEALGLWDQHQQNIDLLLTDMIMPGTMTGLELAQRLRQKKDDLKVIISSGYNAESSDPHSTARQQVVYLPKPYKVATLARVVGQCLEEGEMVPQT
jgi:two-component system, cell cycle sensor histidine kinase and response regulator CckA